jgi:hypothetical protein
VVAVRIVITSLPALALLPACAELVSFPDDPTLADPGPWDCVAAPAPSTPPTSSTVTVRVQTCDSFGDCSIPIEGLSAELCEKLDVGCSRPVLRGMTPVNGMFEIDVPIDERGFDGYLKVTSPTEACSTDGAELGALPCSLALECDPAAPDERCQLPLYAPALFFFTPPIRSEPAQPFVLSLMRLAAVPTLAQAAGAPFDATLGNLVVTGVDCNGARAAGLSYELRQQLEGVTPLYMANGILSNSLAETDATGVGAFVGVPPGFVDVLGSTGDTGMVGGVGVQVSRLAISYATLAPGP